MASIKIKPMKNEMANAKRVFVRMCVREWKKAKPLTTSAAPSL